jgi:ABC-type nitrate/sulfonate/bicarbonate transport system permease component
MPVGGKDFALTILGFLLGTAVGTILSFWYGKSSE